MRRRGLGDNASTYRRIARDAERRGRNVEAQEIYAQAPKYRSLGIVKKDKKGKIRKYKNLAAFNRECPSRGDSGLVCELKSVRRLTDGTGMASVDTIDYRASTIKPNRSGTWRLHFADYGVMLEHLKKRVNR